MGVIKNENDLFSFHCRVNREQMYEFHRKGRPNLVLRVLKKRDPGNEIGGVDGIQDWCSEVLSFGTGDGD